MAKIYTAITGNKEFPREDITVYGEYSEFVRPVMNAKIYKILSHQFIDDDVSIWIDGNIELLISPEQLVEEFLGDADIAVFKHFERDCVYDEAEAAKGLDRSNIPPIEAHAKFLRKKNYPKHNGLYECGIIIRRHSKKIEDFNNAWWSEICRHSSRDQLSFPYTLKKFPDLKINSIVGNPRDHKYFKFTPHPMKICSTNQ